jgi:hypothetical protein
MNTRPPKLFNNGFPQGSVLSRLLFPIYCKDLPFCSEYKTKSLEFAYDWVLYSPDKSWKMCEDNLNDSLANLYVWTKGLEVSVSKSAVCLFSRKRISLQLNVHFQNNLKTNSVKQKFLGLTLDCKL